MTLLDDKPTTPEELRSAELMVLQNLWDQSSKPIKVSHMHRFQGSIEFLYYAVVRWDNEDGGYLINYCTVAVDRSSGQYGNIGTSDDVDVHDSEYLGDTFDEAFAKLEEIIKQGVSF